MAPGSKQKMKCLILFSGTNSVSLAFKKHNIDCRGLDINNKFKPYYNVDILKWNYKSAIDKWTPDIIQCSFVCAEFSSLIDLSRFERDTDTGYQFVNRSLEIIKYAKSKNPSLKTFLENPRSKYVENHNGLNQMKRILVTYCSYGFLYMKPTFIWYDGFEMKLKEPCSKSNPCQSIKNNPNGNRHMVVLGYRSETSVIGCKYFTQLRKNPAYKGYTDTEFRYRIPLPLLEDILKCILK